MQSGGDCGRSATGAKLRFISRYEFQRENSGVSSVKNFKTLLPAAAKDVYYRDDIGNSAPAMKIMDDAVELDLRPRFLLFGGWKNIYAVGYNVPSYEIPSTKAKITRSEREAGRPPIRRYAHRRRRGSHHPAGRSYQHGTTVHPPTCQRGRPTASTSPTWTPTGRTVVDFILSENSPRTTSRTSNSSSLTSQKVYAA